VILLLLERAGPVSGVDLAIGNGTRFNNRLKKKDTDPWEDS